MVEPSYLANHPDLGERTYQILKEEIISGKVAPGTRMVIVDLASKMGVSRTPIADALNRLRAEGYVTEVPRKGFFVSEFSASDVADLMDASLVIQVGAAELGMRHRDPVTIGELWRRIADMEQLIDADGRCPDYSQFVSLDREFHLLIVGSARNRRLVDVYVGLNTHTQVLRILYARVLRDERNFRIAQFHRAIAKAFEAGDFPALKTALTDHLEEAKQALVVANSGEVPTGPASSRVNDLAPTI